MDRQDGELISRAIEAGVRAGAYSYWARQCPEAERGLSKMRDKAHREATNALDRVAVLNRLDVRQG